MSVALEESPPSPEPQYSTELRGETKGAEDDLGKRYHLLQNIEEECTTIYVCSFFCCCRPLLLGGFLMIQGGLTHDSKSPRRYV